MSTETSITLGDLRTATAEPEAAAPVARTLSLPGSGNIDLGHKEAAGRRDTVTPSPGVATGLPLVPVGNRLVLRLPHMFDLDLSHLDEPARSHLAEQVIGATHRKARSEGWDFDHLGDGRFRLHEIEASEQLEASLALLAVLEGSEHPDVAAVTRSDEQHGAGGPWRGEDQK